jgi:hypothetical protein
LRSSEPGIEIIGDFWCKLTETISGGWCTLIETGREALNNPAKKTDRPASNEEQEFDKKVAELVSKVNKDLPATENNDRSNDIHQLRDIFKKLDPASAQKVIKETNKKLEADNLRVAQSTAGEIWMGYKSKNLYKEVLMMTSDRNVRIDDSNVVDQSANSAAPKAHTEVFEDPHQFMSVLNDNFSKLARGHNELNLNDLKIDGEDQSLDPKVRAAAQIAQTHFDELVTIGDQAKNGGDKPSVLTKDGIQFGLDMVDGHTSSHAMGNAAKDTLGVIVGALGVVGTLGGTGLVLTAAGGLAEGAGTAGAIAFWAAGAATAATMGAGALLSGALAADLGYEAATSFHRFNNYSKEDRGLISTWLQ